MKNLEIYIDGGTFGKQGSGFAVILLSLNNIWKRSFATGNYTANLANLQAAKFGLLSIAKGCSQPVSMFIKNKYVRDMLEKDDDGFFKRAPSANKEIIDEIRTMVDELKATVDVCDNEYSKECKELVTNAVKNNEPIDYRK